MAGLQFCTCTAGVQHECVMCGPALCVLHVLYSEGLAEVNRHLYNTYVFYVSQFSLFYRCSGVKDWWKCTPRTCSLIGISSPVLWNIHPNFLCSTGVGERRAVGSALLEPSYIPYISGTLGDTGVHRHKTEPIFTDSRPDIVLRSRNCFHI